ncbi:MAG: FAD-dependent oxidoreductase, partial [Deltaproteobacteria bacterium]|nr:FAD-dependent oxidoreductase [Deltaproteobacteria bacterium]
AAAFRLKRAGFDMTMLHGGHGWLLAQFLSPFSNKRTDAYGGSLENRARFPLKVIERIREQCGPSFAIDYRMSGDELVHGGLTREEAVQFAKLIEDKVDCIHVSAGMMAEPATIPYFHPPTYLPHGPNVHLAENIRNAVNIPVTCVGAITDPEMAERILIEGKADLVAMARALIADPELPSKSYNGKRKEIIPCTRCLDCLGRVAVFLPIRCAVNPVVGRETECGEIRLAIQKRKVLIVGGGPAGMEAGIVAALRGHQVTLYEKEEQLGGNLALAAIPPFKEDMKRFLDYLVGRVNELPIDVKAATEATAETVKAESPDVIVVAAGAVPLIPDIPGANSPNTVWSGDILAGKVQPGEDIIVAGGGLVGCEIALFLAQQGKKVSIIEMLDEVATDFNMVSRTLLLELLGNEGVEIRTGVRLYGSISFRPKRPIGSCRGNQRAGA